MMITVDLAYVHYVHWWGDFHEYSPFRINFFLHRIPWQGFCQFVQFIKTQRRSGFPLIYYNFFFFLAPGLGGRGLSSCKWIFDSFFPTLSLMMIILDPYWDLLDFFEEMIIRRFLIKLKIKEMNLIKNKIKCHNLVQYRKTGRVVKSS